MTIEVICSTRLDPASFKVRPGWAKGYFTPVPGGSETAVLPLKPGVNKISLEAREAKDEKTRNDEGLHHSEKDFDEFEVRLPVPSAKNVGRR